MGWSPGPRVLVCTVAVPPGPSSTVTVSPPVPPMVNVTVPVGVPVAGGTGVTWAVTVTVSPRAEGFGAEVTVVVVAAVLTVCGTLWLIGR